MTWSPRHILTVVLLALVFVTTVSSRVEHQVDVAEDECETCKKVVTDLEARLNDPALQDSVVSFVLTNVCPLLPSDAATTCSQEARVVVAQIAASIQQTFTPEQVCQSMGLCMNKQQTYRSVKQSMSKPWFCHGLECPYFEVLESNDKYEKRRYVEGVWASTRVETYLYAVASPMGFRRLFDYIDEGNELGLKIPMTSPVKIHMEPSCGAFCKQNFTVSFFMPKDWQDDPPKPLSSDVFIETTEATTVYVKSAGGFRMDDITVANMAHSLAEDLEADGKQFDADSFVFAGYDPPFRLRHRHNEVWLTAVDGEDKEGKINAGLSERSNNVVCDACNTFMDSITSLLDGMGVDANTVNSAFDSMENACDDIDEEETKDSCKLKINQVRDIALQTFDEIESGAICTNMCSDAFTKNTLNDLAQQLLEQLRRLQSLPPFQVSDESCDTCKDVIQQAAAIIQEPENQKEVFDFIKQGCSVLPQLEDICDQFVDEFGPLLILSIVSVLDPDTLCTEMGYCGMTESKPTTF